MAEEIELTSTDDGMIVDAEGFKGKTCITALEAIITELEKIGIRCKHRDIKKKVGYSVPAAGRTVRER